MAEKRYGGYALGAGSLAASNGYRVKALKHTNKAAEHLKNFAQGDGDREAVLTEKHAKLGHRAVKRGKIAISVGVSAIGLNAYNNHFAKGHAQMHGMQR